jgi:hypothetical protein
MKRCLCLVVSNNKVTFVEVGLEDKEVIEGDSSNFKQKPIVPDLVKGLGDVKEICSMNWIKVALHRSCCASNVDS